MAKITPTRAELSTLHGIMTRLEWIDREYHDLSPDFRRALNKELGNDIYAPLIDNLKTYTEEMISITEKASVSCDDEYIPSEEELLRYSRALDKITRLGLLNLPLEAKAALKVTTDFKAKLALLEELAKTT